MIKILEEVVHTCGLLATRTRRQEGMDVQNKEETLGQHFSTRADRDSLQCGLAILHRHFPQEPVVAEEKENFADIPLNCTVFDPLDGSTNFFNWLDDFGVTICTLRGGIPQYGATYFPVRDLLISAVRGEGCYIGGVGSGSKITRIPWHGAMDKTQIGADVGSWTHRSETFNRVLKPLSRRFNILSAMSAIEGGRRVLFGHTGAYYNIGVAKIWDAAAMTLAIEEAGGIACAPDGSTLQWKHMNQDWVIAINSELAKLVLEHTRKWKGREKGGMNGYR